MKERNIKLPEGAVVKSWHPKFDLDSVPDIPIADIIPCEDSSKSAIVSNKFHEASNKVTALTQTKPATSLLDRIRQKEKQADLERVLGVTSTSEKNRETSLLLECCDSLSLYFFACFSAFNCSLFGSMSKNSLLLGEVINKISQGSKTAVSSSTSFTSNYPSFYRRAYSEIRKIMQDRS